MTAKDYVNKIYQPLGHLRCGVDCDTMWEYSKSRAIEMVDDRLEELKDDYEMVLKDKMHPHVSGYIAGLMAVLESIKQKIELL